MSTEQRIQEVLESHGYWELGLDELPDALDWAAAGFEPEEVDAWLEAGCFDVFAAVRLVGAGLSPGDCSRLIEYAGQPRSLGYWVANGDISIDDAVAAARA